MDDLAITCDEIIESYNKETKTIPTDFNQNKANCNFYLTWIFINYYTIIDNC